jgi:hypothetical protein
MKYIPLKPIDVKHTGWYFRRLATGELDSKLMGPVVQVKSSKIPPFDVPGVTLVSRPKEPTVNGDCGSLMCLKTPKGYVLYGIHAVISGDNAAIAFTLSQDFLSHYLNEKLIVEPSTPMLVAETASQLLGDLHKKSTFRYMRDGSARVYGSLHGFRATPKSRVEPTPMSEFLLSEGYSIKYSKPVMRGWEPWRIAAQDLVNVPYRFDTHILEQVKYSFLDDILRGLCVHDLEDLFVLDDFSTLNGAAGVRSIDKVKRNTSAGFPWRKSKKYFL